MRIRYLKKFGSGILDGNFGSGINILDPQHWCVLMHTTFLMGMDPDLVGLSIDPDPFVKNRRDLS
jgi:hypothetical protein